MKAIGLECSYLGTIRLIQAMEDVGPYMLRRSGEDSPRCSRLSHVNYGPKLDFV